MTESDPEGSRHAEALELAQAGRHEEALAALQEFLLRHPLDAEALNDAGALLYGLGRLDEAARHLERALGRPDGQAAQVLENLMEVYLAAGRSAQAAALLDGLDDAGILTPELANRTAAALLEDHDCPNAVETLLRSRKLAPQEEHLPAILRKVHALRPKVALVCGPGRKPLPDGLAAFVGERFETRVFRPTGPGALGELLGWCDLAWFEGCSTEAVLASRMPTACMTLLHVRAAEVYGPRVGRADWSNVDWVVASGGRQERDLLARRLPDLARAGRIGHLPVGLAVEKLPFRNRDRGKNLACLGDLSCRRNPMGLLQCFRALHEADGEFRLFFAGYFQDDMLEAYCRHVVEALHLGGAVRFDGWQEDLPAWLADKHFVVSAAIGEEDGTDIAEAMAMGLKPVLHDFPGAADRYGEAALYRTAEEFRRRILQEPYDPPAYRRFVEEHFALESSLARANEFLLHLEARWASAARADAALEPAPRGEEPR
ncbi:MAG TPA: glycosyltransferase [Phycisphaerae bacterium]|nr:glycosyltransferase [Phycisphaerae bacterium]